MSEASEELEVWVFLWREDGKYVAYEPSTGIASQGDSIDEALENLREALELYLQEPDAEPPYRITRVTVTRIRIKLPKHRVEA